MASETRPIRILIGTLPTMLRGMLSEIAARRADVEMVEQTADAQLITVLRHHAADVIALELPDSTTPDLCRSLLAEFPSLVIAGVSENGRQTSIYAHNLGATELLDTVRAIVNQLRQAVAFDASRRGQARRSPEREAE